MTVRELIEMLESEDPDAEVRSMQQPSWPFEYEIAGVVTREAIYAARRDSEPGGDDDDDDEPESDEKPQATVFLLEGRQVCYGDKVAWEAGGY
jgi:hypothetical protein